MGTSKTSSWNLLVSIAVTRESTYSTSSRIPHSQMTMTRQPASVRSRQLRRSRAILPSNFSCQNSRLVEGVVQYLQPTCRCQKHPCTKITVLNLGNTRSGFPGSRASWSRYLNPALCRALLITSSGLVSFPRIDAMIRERVLVSTMSPIIARKRDEPALTCSRHQVHCHFYEKNQAGRPFRRPGRPQ